MTTWQGTDPSTWRLKTTGAGQVPYRIVSMSGEFLPEQADAQMEVLVPANRLMDFVYEMLPSVQSMGGFPLYPARGGIHGTPLHATKVAWKGHVDGKPVDPFGIDSGAPDDTYQSNCSVTVAFSTIELEGGQESDPNDPSSFLELSCSGGGQFLNVSTQKASWKATEGAGAAEEDKSHMLPVNIVVPTIEWNMRWPRIPNRFFKDTLAARLLLCLGKVNSEVMPFLFNAPRGTVLFVGWQAQKSYTWRTGQQPPFSLDLKFEQRYIQDSQGNIRGHNDFWKPGIGWQYLLSDGTNPVYRYENLNILYRI